MRLLHLTDLHIDADIAELTSRFDSIPEDVLKPRFDFAVISGDLVDHATPAQYGRAATFLNRVLETLVDDDRARIVIVPGNHDVSWSDTYPIVTPQHLPPDQLAEAVRAYESCPEKSALRIERSPLAVTRALKLDDTQYYSRFRPFGEFLSAFYANAKTGGHRYLVFNEWHRRTHWGVHYFENDKVAFYAINTCDANDKYHTGASINTETITEIRRHTKTLKPDVLKIGVWHHGLSTGRGRRDHLTFRDVNDLAKAGLDFGIHGHTHFDQGLDLFDVVRRQFPMISTGSFGAEAPERPDGLTNQFSVLHIEKRRRLIWQLWAHKGSPPHWQEEGLSRPFAVGRPRANAQAEILAPAYIGQHKRQVKIHADGIAEVTVTMDQVSFGKDLVLASPLAGFTQAHSSAAKVTKGKYVTQPAVPQEKGSSRFVVDVSLTGSRLDQLTWKYEFSNGYALDRVDAVHRQSRAKADLNLQDGEDAYFYCVEAETDDLTVELTFPPGTILLDVFAVAQRCLFPSVYLPRWTDEPGESNRLADGLSWSENRVSFSIKQPVPGLRYGVRYGFGDKRQDRNSDVQAFINRLITDCRDADRVPERVESLRKAVELALIARLGKVPSLWIVHLWSSRKRKLLPSFGGFSRAHWGGWFEYGSGIAGHAFRFAKAAAWNKRVGLRSHAPPRSRLLYRPAVAPNADPDWIVELPILVHEKGPAVGVIGFAGDERAPSDTADGRLEEIADAVMGGNHNEESRADLDGIAVLASGHFWQSLRDDPVAGGIFNSHWTKWTPELS